MADFTFGDTDLGSSLLFSSPGEQCLNLTIQMDSALETNEDFYVVLLSQQLAVKVLQRSAQVIILDTPSKMHNCICNVTALRRTLQKLNFYVKYSYKYVSHHFRKFVEGITTSIGV